MLVGDKLSETHHRSLLPLQITITLAESAMLIFFNPGLKIAGMAKCLNPQP